MPLQQYLPNGYSNKESPEMIKNEPNVFVAKIKLNNIPVIIKALKDEKELSREIHSSHIYRYAIQKCKDINVARIISAPEARAAKDIEKNELTDIFNQVDNLKFKLSGSYHFMIQEFVNGSTVNLALCQPKRLDYLFGDSNTLRSLGFLAGLDIVFYNSDRLPIGPIFSHHGNLNNIMYFAKNTQELRIVAIDNCVAIRTEKIG